MQDSFYQQAPLNTARNKRELASTLIWRIFFFFLAQAREFSACSLKEREVTRILNINAKALPVVEGAGLKSWRAINLPKPVSGIWSMFSPQLPQQRHGYTAVAVGSGANGAVPRTAQRSQHTWSYEVKDGCFCVLNALFSSYFKKSRPASPLLAIKAFVVRKKGQVGLGWAKLVCESPMLKHCCLHFLTQIKSWPIQKLCFAHCLSPFKKIRHFQPWQPVIIFPNGFHVCNYLALRCCYVSLDTKT